LHGSFFFLLYCRISLIFNIFIKNRISLHNLKEGRGNGSRDLFVEWFGTGKVISIIFREADGFLLLFSHSIKAGRDTIPKVDTVGELLGVESGSHSGAWTATCALGGAQRFRQQFHTMISMHSCHNVRGVSPLASSFFEVALLTQLCHQKLEETMLRLMLNQASPKLGEYAKIEARVGQLQS